MEDEDYLTIAKGFLSCFDGAFVTLSLAISIGILILWNLWKFLAGNPFLSPFLGASYDGGMGQIHREKLLKVGFKPERVPDDLDAIIIGSGMGGLTCAGLMARAGKKVLVLEQHDRIGGSTHVFEEKGLEFDVGVHYIGGMEIGSMNHTLLDVLTDGKLVWEKMDQEFDTIMLQTKGKVEKSFSYHSGVRDYEKRLCEYFPEEVTAISKFMKLLKQCEKAVVGYTIMKQLPKWLLKILVRTGIHNLLFSRYRDVTDKTVKEVLDRLTENKELKFVLGYAFGDYGTFPSEAPFLMHGVLMSHFYHGAYYPRGGAGVLAENIIPGILRAGGAVLARAPVNRITFDGNGAISGVCIFRNGREYEVQAPIVVSSVGLFNTCEKLLPKSIVQKYGYDGLCASVDRGMACFQTFIGFKGTPEELNLKKRNYWVYNSIESERSIKDYLSLSREDAVTHEIPLAFISFPSAKDSSWTARHPGTSVCVVVTLLNWNWFCEWENRKIMKRGPVYNDLKKSFQDQIWHLVCSSFPNLKDKVLYIDSGTPLSHKYYLGCPRGDIYGIDHTVKRFQAELGMDLRPETGIPGLYLTGQDIFTCGIMGASISGLLTSGTILGRNHFLDLFTAMGKRKCHSLFCKLKQIF